MLAKVRLQLTAWYVVVLLAIVTIIIGVAYLVLSSALSSEVDDSLQSSARNIADQIEAREDRPPAVGNDRGGSGSNSGPGSSGEDGSGSDNDYDDDEYGGLEYFSGIGNDVFYLVLDRTGSVIVNPLNVPTVDLIDAASINDAIAHGEAWRTVGSGDDKTRVLYLATDDSAGTGAIVEVGRSLHRHNEQLNSLLKVLLITGAGGLALASLGGFWLAGRALKPTHDAMNRQRQFVSDASHELRTPLTLIRASAEAIQGGSADQLDAADRASLEDIIAESDRMAGLVDELLTQAKLEEGRLELTHDTVDSAGLVEAAAREAELMARGESLTVQIESAEHILLRCDPVRVGQVLRILLDNAVQHTPSGGRIELGVQKTGDGAEFWVQDTGPGIPPEHLEHIFERFYRVDTPRTRGTGGSGLGLSIARQIVEAHGGKIEARSRPEEDGTRFSFTLPA